MILGLDKMRKDVSQICIVVQFERAERCRVAEQPLLKLLLIYYMLIIIIIYDY